MAIQTGLLIAGVLLMTWLGLRAKKLFIRKMEVKWRGGQHGLSATSLKSVEKILTTLIVFISALLILQVLGLDIVPLLTFSGIGAAIVGFASKEVVANFFGGLLIYINRPFAVDETVEIPNRNIRGTVEEMGWYLTTLRDSEKNAVYIPNSIFSTELIRNLSRRSSDME